MSNSELTNTHTKAKYRQYRHTYAHAVRTDTGQNVKMSSFACGVHVYSGLTQYKCEKLRLFKSSATADTIV